MNISSLIITPEILRFITEIEEFRGGWQASYNQNPERLQKLKHVATIESIGSSTRIEGSQLDNSQIEELLGNIGKASFLTRDEQEVAGYAEIMDIIFENYADIPLTENYIKQLHSTLLRHSEKDIRHRGEYKKHSNNVEVFAPDGKSLGIVFETSSPFDTPKEMQELIVWTRETLEDRSYHPLIVIALFNVVFLAIHPFQDGNGRLSRVLISLLLLKAGYSYIPYSSLESIVEKNKDAYYLSLQRTQKTLKTEKVDWLPWLRFFLNSLKRQKDHLLEKTNTDNLYATLPYESMIIMQYVDEHQRITIKNAENIIDGVSRPTIKNRVSKLVEQGLLVRHGKARGTWYSKSN
jgi:Fic family protein